MTRTSTLTELLARDLRYATAGYETDYDIESLAEELRSARCDDTHGYGGITVEEIESIANLYGRTPIVSDVYVTDPDAAELIEEIREAAEKRCAEINEPGWLMLTPGFAPGLRGEVDRIVHHLKEVAAENVGMPRRGLCFALSEAVGGICDAYFSEQDRCKDQTGCTNFILGRRIEVVKAFIAAFIYDIDRKHGF